MEKKYLKYKKKYLDLSKYIKRNKSNNMMGGSISEQMTKYFEITKDKLQEYNVELKNFEEEKKDINILIISDKKEDKPVLVVMAGFSNNSFQGTANILINSIDKLIKKFSKIYIIEYDSYKQNQTDACTLRDKIKEDKTQVFTDVYEPERKLNDEIALRIDDILRNKLKLTNVHLLGKCAGAGVLIHTLVKDIDNSNKIYDALYLGVPGNPFNIQELDKISKDRLKKIKFIFSWTQQDVFVFDWGKTSFEEKAVYHDEMINLEESKGIKIDFTILEQDLKTANDKKLYHEINQKLIDTIVK